MPKATTGMYERSVMQWNPFVGCGFDCVYCKDSFQRQAKRQSKNCRLCYEYKPHEHPRRLAVRLPRTGPGYFIFTCASGDVSFCSTEYLNRILSRIATEKEKTFLIQSKNPQTFNRAAIPENVILGTTIETNRDDLNRREKLSKAPPPSKRFADFLAVKHKRKMVTCEPVLDFDHDTMLDWITQLTPEMVWIGFDSKNERPSEPSREKVLALGAALKARGIEVIYKAMRDGAAPPDGAAGSEESEDGKGSEKHSGERSTEAGMTKAKKRSARLTDDQKRRLGIAHKETGSFQGAADEVKVSYAQARNYLIGLAGVKKKVSKGKAVMDSAGSCRDILTKIKAAQRNLEKLQAEYRSAVAKETEARERVLLAKAGIEED